jgi:hypothetical protein
LYDCVNGPLERAILAPRRAGLLPERFDPFPRVVPTRPMLQAAARNPSS